MCCNLCYLDPSAHFDSLRVVQSAALNKKTAFQAAYNECGHYLLGPKV